MKITQLRFYRNISLVLGLSFSSIIYSNKGFSQQLAQSDESGMQITNEPVVVPQSPQSPLTPLLQQPIGELNDEFKAIDPETIINIGKIVWEVVKAGKPVVNIQTDSATALPEGVTNWHAMSGWKTPLSKPYSFNWKLLGANVVTFDYSVVYTYGGNLNGIGQYLANVMIVPTNVKVFWGYQFAAEVKIIKVLNIGTSKNPVGAVQMVVKWTLDSAVAHHERSSTFFVTGAGDFQQISHFEDPQPTPDPILNFDE